MNVILVSDLHLLGPKDPNQRLFIQFLGELPKDTILCLLGDVFQFWWHKHDAIFEAYEEVIAALEPWKNRLYFIYGNHDFHAPPFLERRLGACCARTLSLDFDGTRTYLSHGDACDRSQGYHWLSWFLQGRLFATVMDLSWPWGPWRFLEAVSHGKYHGPNPHLLKIQHQLAQEQLDQGHQLVVFGHTHAPGQHPLKGGTYVNLGDWVMHHSYLEIRDGVPTLKPYHPPNRQALKDHSP